ncbi:MAG: SDR family oxidoreductase [Bacteroidales bacterium]
MMDKVVVITGASSGIGKALAWEYACKGSRVVIAARNREKLESLAADMRSRKHEVLYQQTDVSKEADCRELIRVTAERYGRIDILINNAGISMRALFEDLELEVIRRLMDVNFWGTVYCTKYAFPWLLESKGSLVGVSSVAGFKGLPARTGYTASKAAIHGFLDVIRLETRKKGLHVLLACPGFTASNIRKTALTENGKPQGNTPRNESSMMSAEEVARHIYRAVAKRKRMIVLTSEGKIAYLLSKFAPRLLDKIVYNQMAKEPDSPLP